MDVIKIKMPLIHLNINFLECLYTFQLISSLYLETIDYDHEAI